LPAELVWSSTADTRMTSRTAIRIAVRRLRERDDVATGEP
jgi:hypothetical protein